MEGSTGLLPVEVEEIAPEAPRMGWRRATRRATLVLVAAGIVGPPAAADTYPRQPGVDVDHYAFELTLSDATDAIRGEATVDVVVLEDGVAALTLDLVQASESGSNRGMTVSGVSEGGRPLHYEHAGDRLRISLDPPGRRGARRRVTVRYGGIAAAGLVVGPNAYGERTFFSDNWPDKARNWLPTIDHPHDKATCELVVTAPAWYQVVSNGLLLEETDLADGQRRTHWRQSVPISPWLFALGVARFAVDHRPPWRGIPIQTWVYPQDRDTGFRVFAEPTVDVLDFLANRVGPYPYEKLAQVQAQSVNGGMESASAIFYAPESATGEGVERWRNVVIHEIAHQWFGNAVTEADWDDVWLSEGFATYFTHLYKEHAEGRDVMVARLRADQEVIRTFDEENPDYRIVHDDLSDMQRVVTSPGTYKKGAWVLHMLRGMVGDAAFWRGVRDYYARYRNGNATTADFRRAMEGASGRDLRWFFDQWLRRGGMLKVRATWAWDPDEKTLRVEVDQVQASPPFRMPVELGLAVDGGAERRLETIEIMARQQSFTIPLETEPRSVTLDPRTLVLMDAEVQPAPIAAGPPPR
jgi:aminopeptidase N